MDFFIREYNLRQPLDETDRSAHSGSSDSVIKLEKWSFSFQIRVGDDGGGGGDGGGDGGDDGRIFPEHPSPILHASRDIISRKGKSLTPIQGI